MNFDNSENPKFNDRDYNQNNMSNEEKDKLSPKSRNKIQPKQPPINYNTYYTRAETFLEDSDITFVDVE